MMNVSVDAGEMQLYDDLAGFSPVDCCSVWELCATDDLGTVGNVKEEVEASGSHEGGSLSWEFEAQMNSPSSPMPQKRTRSFRDIVRDVRVSEETLQCAVARLGGGTRGLQVLVDHVNHWASESYDEDVTATIRKGIADLGMPPALKRQCNPGSTNGDANVRGPCFDAQWKDGSRGTCETMNHGAAYTRALRKSHMARQRGQVRAQRHHSMSKSGHHLRQWRTSANNQWSQDLDPELGNGNGKGYEFLFQKELRASDVSSLGRIVLPKKDAERHLPSLIAREGVMITLEDYQSGTFWTVRYRFWPNNKSRMYLMENVGGFVTFHRLQEGDLLLCYRNGQGGYVIRGQKVPPSVKAPAKGLGSKFARVRENIRTTEMKTISAAMSPTPQFMDGDQSTTGTDSSELANSSFDSLECTLEEIGDGIDFEDCRQSCVDQQAGYHSNYEEDVLKLGFPASYRPLALHDSGFDPVVAMLSVNVRQRYMDEGEFFEV